MENFLDAYHQAVQGLLDAVSGQEKETIDRAAALIASACAAQHVIYVFGCTHSAILAEDVFYRAGAPAFWRPLWGPGMNIATTPGFLTSAAEHNEALGRDVIACSRLTRGDVLVVLSTSGKNAAPVAAAAEALERGAGVIAVSSSAYSAAHGNHSKYPSLWAIPGLLMIDNHVPLGDASVPAAGVPMGPLSTIAGSFIMHALSAAAVEKLSALGIEAPVFRSSNAPGGLERNLALLEQPGMRETFLLP